jgi:hypothetical protein
MKSAAVAAMSASISSAWRHHVSDNENNSGKSWRQTDAGKRVSVRASLMARSCLLAMCALGANHRRAIWLARLALSVRISRIAITRYWRKTTGKQWHGCDEK